MPSTAFSTNFRKLKRRINIVQDISEMGNSNLNLFSDYYAGKDKPINLLSINKKVNMS